MEPTEEPINNIYVFYTEVDTVPIPDTKFNLKEMQGFFVVHHDLKPGDRVKVTIEKVPNAHPDHDNQT